MGTDHQRQTVSLRDRGASRWAGASFWALPARLLSNRPARPALLVLLALLFTFVPTLLARGGPRFAAAQSGPTITINPTQGPVGTTIQLSALDFPNGDRDQTATYLFDGVQMGKTGFVPCVGGAAPNGFGFGTGCSSNAMPVSLTVPLAATGGPHAIAVSDPAGNVASTVFTIPQQATATPTPPTATTTGTPVATATLPPHSTATPTHGPASPTATPPVTPTPKPAFPLVVLTSPLHLFSGGTLALSLHATAGSHIGITLEFIAVATSGHGHGAIHAGAVLYTHQAHGTANGAGLFWLTLHIAYTPHVRARVTLIVTAHHGTTFTARRVFG